MRYDGTLLLSYVMDVATITVVSDVSARGSMICLFFKERERERWRENGIRIHFAGRTLPNFVMNANSDLLRII